MTYGIPDAKRAPSSRAFDGTTTNDYMRDPTTGRYLSRHWVDSAAYFYLRIEQGSIKSAPQIGQRITKIKYIDKHSAPSLVSDLVLEAWAPLLSRGVIRVVSIPVDLSHPGAIFYQANYVNLVLGRDGVTPQLPIFP